MRTQLKRAIEIGTDLPTAQHLAGGNDVKRRAMEEPVRWLETGVPQISSVAVFTDYQFLCTALLGYSIDIDPSDSNLKFLEYKSLYSGFQYIIIS